MPPGATWMLKTGVNFPNRKALALANHSEVTSMAHTKTIHFLLVAAAAAAVVVIAQEPPTEAPGIEARHGESLRA